MRLRKLACSSTAIALAAAAALTSTTLDAAVASGSSVASGSDSPSAAALPDAGFGAAQRAEAIASYQKAAASTAAALGLTAGSGLAVKDVVKDGNGTVHVRYTRTYQGLPVIGGDLVVHGAQTGSASDVTWDKAGNFTAGPDLTAAVSGASAAAAAGAAAATAQQVVWALDGTPRLAWKVLVPKAHGLSDVVVSDASTGARIARYSNEQEGTVDGTGKTLYSGNVTIKTNKVTNTKYQLIDNTRGGHRVTSMNGTTGTESATLTNTNNIWGNNAESNPLTVAADAQYGAAETWDFYQSLGRNGIRNDGVGARSRVHFDTNYDNAFWSDACFCMSYGDGSSFDPLVPLDVAGHEMTHGVTSNTAGLIYLGESGGLNEATSDIMGTSVEFFAANAVDKGDYYIGEEIAASFPGNALRRMDKPSLDGASYDCYTPFMGRDDVHYTSGVANHFFYLLSEGKGAKTIGGRPHNSTGCNATAVTPIGRTNAAKIWYRALSVYMVTGSDYQDARDATIRAAKDLFPSGPTCQRVTNTWTAVDVTVGNWTCGGVIDPPGTNKVKNPGFEAATTGANWVQSRSGIINQWTVNGDNAARSGSKVALLRGLGSAGTDTITQNNIAVPAGSPQLVYYLFVDSNEFGSSAFDTFKVQVKKGAATTTVQSLDNTDWDDSYHRMEVNLSAYAGQTVSLKFTATEDSSVPSFFLVDDISIS